jgi:hypothetical protein
MPRCEDFPCCGHGTDGCPDADLVRRGYLPYPCVECGGQIRARDAVRGHESFHRRCLRRFLAGVDTGDDYRDDY